MAIFTMPANLAIAKAGQMIGQRRYDLNGGSDSTGAAQVRLFGPPRWMMTLQAPEGVTIAEADVWQTLLMQLRGRVNHLAAWDTSRPAPLGTMRGTLTLNTTAVAGDVALSVTGGAGQAATTLKAMDWLQIGAGLTSQLVKVTANATANGSGVIALTIEPPLRTGYASGTAVAWSTPLAHFKAANDDTQWRNWGTRAVQGLTLDLLEQWS
jgi:hypothetical protein